MTPNLQGAVSVAFWIPLLSAVWVPCYYPVNAEPQGWLSIRFTYSSLPCRWTTQQSSSGWHGLPHLARALSCEEQRSRGPFFPPLPASCYHHGSASSSQTVPPGGLPASEKLQCCRIPMFCNSRVMAVSTLKLLCCNKLASSCYDFKTYKLQLIKKILWWTEESLITWSTCTWQD